MFLKLAELVHLVVWSSSLKLFWSLEMWMYYQPRSAGPSGGLIKQYKLLRTVRVFDATKIFIFFPVPVVSYVVAEAAVVFLVQKDIQ